MIDSCTEGERWIRAELLRLRERRWRPLALARFLAAARRRAVETRRQRPTQARQAATWMLAGAVAWMLGACAVPDGSIARARRAGLVWWAGCALMLDWHLGMLETPEGRPVALAAPDGLTLLRAWLTPAAAHDASPALLACGALSDLADGLVARRTRTTRLGRDLEALVDACFVVAALRSAESTGRLSRAPARLEQGRILAGALIDGGIYFVAGRAPRAPRAGGRPAAPLRMGALVVAGVDHPRGRRIADGMLGAATGLALGGAALGRRAPGWMR